MTTAERTICPFCGMGCSLLLRTGMGSAYHGETARPTLDYDAASPINRGSLCAKGNMTLELLRHHKRLESPLVRHNGRARRVSWNDAIDLLGERLLVIREESGPAALGIIVGSHLTVEEARLAARLACHLGTRNLDFCQPEDRALLGGLEAAGAQPRPVLSAEEIEAMTTVLVVGDLFTLAPCIAKPILRARYDRKRNVLAVLDSTVNRTGWFGKPMLVCRPGQEVAALALLLGAAIQDAQGPARPWIAAAKETLGRLDVGELETVSGLRMRDVSGPAAALACEPESGVFYASGFGGTERLDLASGLGALLAEATGSRFLAMPTGPNAIGVRRVLREEGFPDPTGLTTPEMIEAGVTGDIKGLLVLGCDLLGLLPDRVPRTAAEHLALLAVTAPMPGETTAAAHVVLPSQAWGEKPGTVCTAFGRQERLGASMPPPGGARADAEILRAIAQRLGAPDLQAAPVSTVDVRPGPTGNGRFFEELELYCRTERRQRGRTEAGTHVLLPRYLPPHAGDGWLTRRLSWPRHESPQALVSLSPVLARTLGVAVGDPVLVRSRDSEVVLRVRVEQRVPDGVVMAPPHHPEMRRLLRWRLDPALRDLDLRPGRVSVEPRRGGADG